jgi:hypothetical protein
MAVSVWGDIDLVDDFKPRRGDLSPSTRETVERALAAYADELAKLYGGLDAVYLLDSVGGAYLLGAPEATLPIARQFSDEPITRGQVLSELIERSNDWLAAAQERVETRIASADAVLDPDWVNNHNRAYKLPLSIHATHDAVVTPLDTSAPTFETTPIGAVDDQLIATSREWAEQFTTPEHQDRVANLVAQLWPEYISAASSWADALEAWVGEQEPTESTADPAVAAVSNTSNDTAGTSSKMAATSERELKPGRRVITPEKNDVFDALDRIDVEAVAERTIVHQWTADKPGVRDNAGSEKRAFVPVWGPNARGTANYIDLESNVWMDTGADDHGTVVEMALIHRENWPRGKIAKGDDWGRGITELQHLGFDIPVWTPDVTTAGYNRMPDWAVRRAAIALGIVDEDEAPHPRRTGGDYCGLGDEEIYRRSIAAITDVGLTPARDDSIRNKGLVETPRIIR